MIVAGTGHRPAKLGGYGTVVSQKLQLLAHDWLAKCPTKVDLVITGMALGWDQALGFAAHNFGIPFEAAIPFEGQEAMWPESSKEAFRRLLSHASKVTYVCEPGYAAWKMQKRNEYMVEQLSHPMDLLLALYDGTSGGTRNCIEYAKWKHIPIVNLWNEWSKTCAS